MQGGMYFISRAFFNTPLQAELELQWKLQACQVGDSVIAQTGAWLEYQPAEIWREHGTFEFHQLSLCHE